MPATRKQSGTIVNARFYARLNLLTDHLTLAAMGKMTATHPETVRRFVEGINRPTFEWCARLCRALGASLDWLAYGTGRGPRR